MRPFHWISITYFALGLLAVAVDFYRDKGEPDLLAMSTFQKICMFITYVLFWYPILLALGGLHPTKWRSS